MHIMFSLMGGWDRQKLLFHGAVKHERKWWNHCCSFILRHDSSISPELKHWEETIQNQSFPVFHSPLFLLCCVCVCTKNVIVCVCVLITWQHTVCSLTDSVCECVRCQLDSARLWECACVHPTGDSVWAYWRTNCADTACQNRSACLHPAFTTQPADSFLPTPPLPQFSSLSVPKPSVIPLELQLQNIKSTGWKAEIRTACIFSSLLKHKLEIISCEDKPCSIKSSVFGPAFVLFYFIFFQNSILISG